MILRPVMPASPSGPPITNRPVGLTRYVVFASSHSSGMTFLMRSSINVSRTSFCFTFALRRSAIDSLFDVVRLLGHFPDDATGIRMKLTVSVNVSDVADRGAYALVEIKL